MSLTSVLLPEPQTPVTTVMTPSGKRAVMFCRLCSRAPFDGDPFAGERARRQRGAGCRCRRERYWPVSDAGHAMMCCGRAFGDDVAAEFAGAGAEVEDIVGVADGVFVVLDDEDGVAEVAQVFEGGDEALVVALMQADGRLIEDVEHAAQARADLRGEADALAFAAGERGGVAVEREIAEADGVEEFEAFDDLAAEAVGDEGFARGEVEIRMRR